MPQEDNKDYADLKSLNGVEIFATGKWNGDTYTQEDLQEMVNSFIPLKQTLQPFVKLGHNEKQSLLAKDGLPAAGWIENIYIQGNKLMADIVDMPATIYELVKNKAYKRISSEIYWNLKDATGTVFKRALKAIALLGGDTPAVGSLADVQALYAKKQVSDLDGEIKFAEIEYFKKEDTMELEKLQAQVTELTSKLEAKGKEFSELEKAHETLEKAKADADAKVSEFEFSILKNEVEKKVTDLISRKKMLPAQKQFAIDTLMTQVDVKTYSENKEGMLDDNSLVKMFEEGADVVDTEEVTGDEQPADEKAKEEEKAKEVKEATSYEEAKKVYNKKGVE